jgi:hypothetical protein
MRIGRDVTLSFHEKFEVLCEVEQMIEVDVMTEFDMILE